MLSAMLTYSLSSKPSNLNPLILETFSLACFWPYALFSILVFSILLAARTIVMTVWSVNNLLALVAWVVDWSCFRTSCFSIAS